MPSLFLPSQRAGFAASGAVPRLAPQRLRQLVVLVGLALTGTVLAVEIVRYLALDAYLDHIEGSVASVGWGYAHGAPLYSLRDGYAEFTNIWGPYAYLTVVPALAALGPSVFASKLAAFMAAAATLALTAWRYRRGPAMPAVQGLFLLVAGMAALSPMSFWIRADPFEMLLVALALASPSPIVVGVCVGVAANFKIHAFLYFLPILAELWLRRGWRAAPPVAFAAVAMFLLPFLAPGISLADYATTVLPQLAGRRHAPELFAPVAAYGIAFALPVLLPLLRRPVPAVERAYGWAALGTLVLLAYPATLSGAGPYHFLPLLPVIAEARRRLAPQGIGAEFAVFPLLLFAAVTTQHCLADLEERRAWPAYAEEALQLAAAQPGPVAIGYGDNRRSYEIAQLVRSRLALSGAAPLLDAQIAMELREIGVDGSRRYVAELTGCRTPRWLTPRGEAPFAVRSYFYDGGPLFDDAFRTAFLAHYRPVATSAHFVLWACGR